MLCFGHFFSIKMFHDVVNRVLLGRTWIVGCNLDNWKGFLPWLPRTYPCHYSWYAVLCPPWLNIFYRCLMHSPTIPFFPNKTKGDIIACCPKPFRDRKWFPPSMQDENSSYSVPLRLTHFISDGKKCLLPFPCSGCQSWVRLLMQGLSWVRSEEDALTLGA